MSTKTSIALRGLGPRALRDPKMRALTLIKSLREKVWGRLNLWGFEAFRRI